MINLNVVHLKRTPIYRQLEMEEALLRVGRGNWCLMNDGTDPAIVMGMTSTSSEVVEGCRLPLIRRFSGGGIVVVDEETLFFSLILDEQSLPCAKNPVDVMAWTGKLLAPAFVPHVLSLEEQDYVIDGQKIGGNAQSFSCGRVVHHTSFLWSWSEENMAFLHAPQRQPAYRQHRSHSAFCNKLSRYFSAKEQVFGAIEACLQTNFHCQVVHESAIDDVLCQPHRKALTMLRK